MLWYCFKKKSGLLLCLWADNDLELSVRKVFVCILYLYEKNGCTSTPRKLIAYIRGKFPMIPKSGGFLVKILQTPWVLHFHCTRVTPVCITRVHPVKSRRGWRMIGGPIAVAPADLAAAATRRFQRTRSRSRFNTHFPICLFVCLSFPAQLFVSVYTRTTSYIYIYIYII